MKAKQKNRVFRGIALPVNMVVVLAVVLMVLVSLSFFFGSSSSQFGAESDARRYFSSTCPQLRCGYETSAVLKDEYAKFYDACRFIMGPEAEEKPYACLQQCGCSMDVSNETVQENINDFVALLRKPA